MALAAALAGLAGVGAAGLMPRGPTSRVEVLALMAGVLLVGGGTGLLLCSRWALLLAPVLYLAGFELARATVFDVPGVVFGPVHLDTSGSMLLVAIGHGFYALVTAPPLLLGAILGTALAHRRARRAPDRRTGVRQVLHVTRRGLALLLTALLAAGVGFTAVRFAQTGQVDPVVGADGRAVPGSIAVHEQVRLGGADQWISIRGRSVDNPVLLYLSGGPGGSDLGYVRHQPRLEDHFTVVVWEQRGTGMSYPTIDPTSRMTLEQLVSDGVELSRLLTKRFDEQRIYLVTNSWGSTLGVLMAQRSPELFRAYVGTGQMVSQRATDQLLYRDVLAYLQRTGDRATERKLRAWGPPPWDDPDTDALAHTTMLLYYEDLQPYPQSAELPANGMVTRFFPGEYGLIDSWNALRGLGDMFSVIYPQLQRLDFRQSATRLEVPVYVLEGRHELRSRTGLALAWFNGLQAPSKQLIWFDRSGHNPQFEERSRFDDLMVGKILKETSGVHDRHRPAGAPRHERPLPRHVPRPRIGRSRRTAGSGRSGRGSPSRRVLGPYGPTRDTWSDEPVDLTGRAR